MKKKFNSIGIWLTIAGGLILAGCVSSRVAEASGSRSLASVSAGNDAALSKLISLFGVHIGEQSEQRIQGKNSADASCEVFLAFLRNDQFRGIHIEISDARGKVIFLAYEFSSSEPGDERVVSSRVDGDTVSFVGERRDVANGAFTYVNQSLDVSAKVVADHTASASLKILEGSGGVLTTKNCAISMR